MDSETGRVGFGHGFPEKSSTQNGFRYPADLRNVLREMISRRAAFQESNSRIRYKFLITVAIIWDYGIEISTVIQLNENPLGQIKSPQNENFQLKRGFEN